jgi:hypothetical protein
MSTGSPAENWGARGRSATAAVDFAGTGGAGIGPTGAVVGGGGVRICRARRSSALGRALSGGASEVSARTVDVLVSRDHRGATGASGNACGRGTTVLDEIVPSWMKLVSGENTGGRYAGPAGELEVFSREMGFLTGYYGR